MCGENAADARAGETDDGQEAEDDGRGWDFESLPEQREGRCAGVSGSRLIFDPR